jgi:glycosyltransferase involved in cell wall biosynthesis
VDQAECVIIGDNASTDGTEAICREFADKYKHIQYFRCETNIGSVQNLVRLAHKVETEFVLHIGAHDVLPDNYVTTIKNLLNENPDAVCAYGNCSYLELDGTVSKTLDFASVRTGMLDVDSYIRAATFFRGKQPCDLIYGLYRSDTVIPIYKEIKQIAGCDHFLVVAALLDGKFVHTPGTTYLRRMMHPNDTDKDYMARIVGDNSPKKLSRDYSAAGKQILDWVCKHHIQQKYSPEQEKTYQELLYQIALKFDTPTTHPFWNCVFFLRKLWRRWCKLVKCKFVPGYAERKNCK